MPRTHDKRAQLIKAADAMIIPKEELDPMAHMAKIAEGPSLRSKVIEEKETEDKKEEVRTFSKIKRK